MSPDPPAAPSLQDVVLRLQRFWSQRGCLLLPGCDFGVPYATLQPDSFFRVLGAEPWQAARLQPVRRPLDGRHGEHPYRLIKHLQLQVVLKPPPAEVETLYLESLAAVGLELELHDLRFVEWQWELVSLGARGRGWHALLDGLGVARLTYLERLADRDLDPASFEISYGLERLSMSLQAAESAFAVSWSEVGPDYGHLRRRDEQELSRYVVEIADADAQRHRLETLRVDAERCLEAGLARAAYELAVKCLEPLDVLDARGDLSARERAAWLERIRQLVKAAADLHQTAAGGRAKRAVPRKGTGPRGKKKAAGKAAAGSARKVRRRGRAKQPRKTPEKASGRKTPADAEGGE